MSHREQSGEAFARDMALCSFCPKMCRSVCPVGNAEFRETTTTWGKMWHAYRIVEHGFAMDKEAARIFDACTGCGACTAFCEHGVDAASALFAMRHMAFTAGDSERSAQMAERYDSNQHTQQQDLFQLYSKEISGEPGEKALYAGAAALTLRPGLAALALRTMQEIKAELSPLPAELASRESGKALLWAGLFERFDANAEKNTRALEGVNTLVCLDPEDAYCFSVVYPERGFTLRPRVTTLVEELARVLDRLPVRPGVSVAYHDPCYLGRRLGVYSAPRRVIEHVLEEPPLEFAWCREHAECVGGGGLYPQANQQGAKTAAEHRWASRPEGASAIVTACPEAEALLLGAGAKVLDVVELVAGKQVAQES